MDKKALPVKTGSTSFSLVAEREKLKQSILRAFRAQQHCDVIDLTADEVLEPVEKDSQNDIEEMAKIAGKPNTRSKSASPKKADVDHQKITVEHSPGTLHHNKRRRTRAERDMRYFRGKTKSSKDNSKKQKNMVQHITSLGPAVKSAPFSSSNITQNRLTMRLGLFGKAKRSSTVRRDILHVPESVAKKTEEDMRRILGHSSASEITQDNMEKRCSDQASQEERTRAWVASISGSAKSAISFPHSNSPNAMEVEPPAGITHASSLPPSPDVPGIAQHLLEKISIETHYPGTGILAETKATLLRLLRQNQPPDETPMKKTPASVQRSLLDSLPPPIMTDSPVMPAHSTQSSENGPVVAKCSSLPASINILQNSADSTIMDATVMFSNTDNSERNNGSSQSGLASQPDMQSQHSSHGHSSQDTMHAYKTRRSKPSEWPPSSRMLEHVYVDGSSSYRPGIDKLAQAYGYFEREGRNTCVIPAGHVISSHVIPARHGIKVGHDHDYIPSTVVKGAPLQVPHQHVVSAASGGGLHRSEEAATAPLYSDIWHSGPHLLQQQLNIKPRSETVVTQYTYPDIEMSDCLALQHHGDTERIIQHHNALQDPEAMDFLDMVDQESAKRQPVTAVIPALHQYQRGHPSTSHRQQEKSQDISPQLQLLPAPAIPRPNIDSPSPKKMYPRRVF